MKTILELLNEMEGEGITFEDLEKKRIKKRIKERGADAISILMLEELKKK